MKEESMDYGGGPFNMVIGETHKGSESSLNDLLPCPFCGGVAHLMKTRKVLENHTNNMHETLESSFWVKCTYCEVSQYFYKNACDAVEKWNERKSYARQQGIKA